LPQSEQSACDDIPPPDVPHTSLAQATWSRIDLVTQWSGFSNYVSSPSSSHTRTFISFVCLRVVRNGISALPNLPSIGCLSTYVSSLLNIANAH
jgi:hypothetical protein